MPGGALGTQGAQPQAALELSLRDLDASRLFLREGEVGGRERIVGAVHDALIVARVCRIDAGSIDARLAAVLRQAYVTPVAAFWSIQ